MTCPPDRDTIQQGSVAPYHLRTDWSNPNEDPSDVDFLDVVSASFRVTRPDGSEEVWPATIEIQSETLLRVSYPFSAGDLDQLGEHRVCSDFALSTGGPLHGEPVWFTVTPC